MVKMSRRQRSTLRREFDSTQLCYVPLDTCLDWTRNRCLIFVKFCVKSQYLVDNIIAVQMRKNNAFDVKLNRRKNLDFPRPLLSYLYIYMLAPKDVKNCSRKSDGTLCFSYFDIEINIFVGNDKKN